MLTILSILFCWPNVNAGVHFCPHCRTLHWTASRVGLARRHQQRRGQSGCLLMVNGLVWNSSQVAWVSVWCRQYKLDLGHALLSSATDMVPSVVLCHIPYIVYHFAIPESSNPGRVVVCLQECTIQTKFVCIKDSRRYTGFCLCPGMVCSSNMLCAAVKRIGYQ